LSIENVPPAEALHRADGHGETIARYRTPAQPRRRSLGFGFEERPGEPPPSTVCAVRAAKTCCCPNAGCSWTN